MSERFEALKRREEKLLCRTYARYPVSVVKGKGSRLWDIDGREYIDLLAGIAVTSLGHCNEELAQVMSEHARKLIHVSNLFYQEEQLDLAERLLATAHCQRVFFCNSGAEANEAAVKITRRYMQRVQKREAFEIITLDHAFHGRTLTTLSATGQPKYLDGFSPVSPGFVQVEWGKLEAIRAAITPATAGVLIEVIQGEGGVRPMSMEYAKAIEALCREKDLLLLIDEVQTGMGRTGAFWGFQQYGLKPDVFTTAKALANGLPMGAMFCTEKIAHGFDYGSHATTFGGGALLSAVASRVVDIMHRDKLPERAARVGAAAMERFRAIGRKYPGTIEEVRGMGLIIGIVLSFPGKEVWNKLIERGFILNLTQDRVLRLVPALNIDEADMERFAQTLEAVLAEGPGNA